MNYAFLVGANSKGLRYAESDVKKIEKVLKDRGYLLNEIRFQANASEVLSEFHSILSKLTANDNILFYFVGHGIANNNTVQLALNTTVFNDDYTYLNSADIMSSFAISRCGSKLMILDCCESANIFIQNLAHITDFELVTVAESWQKTPEIEELESGAFAHFFLKGLSDPSASINGRFTTHSIVTWIQKQIDHFNQEHSPKIPNIIKANGKNVYEFVLGEVKDIPILFEESLNAKLTNILLHCKEMNIFPYTSFIYSALLSDINSLTFNSFEKVRSSFGKNFSLLLEDFHNKLRSNEIAGKGYEMLKWTDQDYILTALDYASSKNSHHITEQALIYGLIKNPSNTTLKLQQILDKDFEILLKYIENAGDDPTPIF